MPVKAQQFSVNEEEKKKTFTTPGGTITDLAQGPVKATEFTNVNGVPTPTVATGPNPIVPRGAVNLEPVTPAQAVASVDLINPAVVDNIGEPVDIRTTNIGEVLSDDEKQSIFEKERDMIRNEKNISFEERNKKYRKLSEDYRSGALFGGETQVEMERLRGEADKARINEQASDVIKKTEDLFAQQLEKETQRIREQGQKVMDTTQRLNSLRGAGRSSANEADIMKQQEGVSALISSAEQNADLALQKRKLEIEGAESEAITAINERIASNEKILNQRIAEAQLKQQELDATIAADVDTRLDNSIAIMEAGGVDTSGIDLNVTRDSGENYFLKSDGSVWLDKSGKPMAYTKNEFNQEVQISQFKDANDNTYVYENGNLNRIITNDGDILTGEQLNTVKVPAQVQAEKSAENQQNKETQLRKEFISRPEVKRFQDIRSQFERVKQGAEADTPAGDLALIFSFMKMLDPASVVREGEFATAQNATGVPDQIRNWYNRVKEGTRLNQDQRQEFKTTAENLFKTEIGIYEGMKNSYKKIVEDAGARPDFVIVDDIKIETPSVNYSDEQSSILDQTFGGGEVKETTNKLEFKAPSGKIFNIPPEEGFNIPDQTGGPKVIPTSGFEEQINLKRPVGSTNVGKDTNNPGNITADSIPSNYTKKEYGELIGATGTYKSPNGREYFVFPDVNSGGKALERDIKAKIEGRSRVLKPTDTLARFQEVYVGQKSSGYLSVLTSITGANKNTPIKNINPALLTKAVMKAEGFNT